ncbi:MAG: OmpH family outer membrane protein [Schwartzia sp. (in: firmicutes)]
MKKFFLAAAFAFGALFCAMPSSASAAPASTDIGYVQLNAVFGACPEIAKIQRELSALRDKLQQQFDSQGAEMEEAERAELQQKLTQQLAQRDEELMIPVREKVRKAVEATAKEKGIQTVIEAGAVLFGGVDLTADVVAKVK